MRLSFPDQASKLGDNLPDYVSPPVVESSVGIQFDGLTSYHSLHAADFWRAVQADYPVVEEKPPLDPVFETFGPSDGAFPEPQFHVLAGPIQPRFFFIAKDGSELIQLQRDRLFFNWRKTEKANNYPRYPHVRAKLEQHLDQLYAWATRNRLGEVVPTQCEAVYVNKIPLHDADGNECGLSHVFPWLAGLKGRTEDGAFVFRRRLHDEEGTPIARLAFNLRYGTDEFGKREAQLLLSVRGRPKEPTIDGCLELIDAEREVIVQTFTEVTADTAHQMWERRQ